MENDKFFEFEPSIKDVVRKNLRKRRKELGYTQEQVALMAEISYDFMRRIEVGKGRIGFSVQTLYKLALVLDISVDELMELKK